MPKSFYVAVFLAACLVGGGFIFYRTPLVRKEAGFGGVSLRLEYATTEAERERGLGGRGEIPSDYGMLFVFENANKYGFWMKDMQVPIDVFWLDAGLRVVGMTLEVATSTYPDVFYPLVPVSYVLETRAGLGRATGIATGTPLLLPNK